MKLAESGKPVTITVDAEKHELEKLAYRIGRDFYQLHGGSPSSFFLAHILRDHLPIDLLKAISDGEQGNALGGYYDK